MNAPDATYTNGRYELPPSARGVLVLAHPPEAGWRVRTPSDDRCAAERQPSAPPDHERDHQQACEGRPT
jgi:hypothetical protein